jgi:hypothetical protein
VFLSGKSPLDDDLTWISRTDASRIVASWITTSSELATFQISRVYTFTFISSKIF